MNVDGISQEKKYIKKMYRAIVFEPWNYSYALKQLEYTNNG